MYIENNELCTKCKRNDKNLRVDFKNQRDFSSNNKSICYRFLLKYLRFLKILKFSYKCTKTFMILYTILLKFIIYKDFYDTIFLKFYLVKSRETSFVLLPNL